MDWFDGKMRDSAVMMGVKLPKKYMILFELVYSSYVIFLQN